MAAPTMTPSVTISFESMKRRHLRQIMRIERQVYPRPWSHAVFVNEIGASRDERFYMVAKVGKRIVGYGGVMRSTDAVTGEPSAHVTNIAVDPGYHRLRLGTCLMVELVHAAQVWSSTCLTLEVRFNNVAAQELYKRFGFLQEGVRKRYYENRDDALVMWVRNIDQPAYGDRLESLRVGLPPTEWEI